MTQVFLRLLERTTEPFLNPDRKWESFCLNFFNVIHRDNVWHMWYNSYDLQYQYDCDAYLCYARSTDGLHWEKPSLGLIEYEGSKANNIVYDGRVNRANLTTVFLDEQAPASERFKGLAQKFEGRNAEGSGIWRCYGAVSPDGFHWNLLPESHYPFNSDTQNVCLPEKGRYRQYLRLWRVRDETGTVCVSTETRGGFMRTIGLTESTTFTHFPRAEEILAPDSDDPPDMDFYNSACTRLKDDLYVMFISCYHKTADVIRVQAAVSTNGRDFQRIDRRPVLDLGNSFDSKVIYVIPGAVPGKNPNTWWFYYLGLAQPHNDTVPQKTRYAGGYGRFLVEIR